MVSYYKQIWKLDDFLKYAALADEICTISTRIFLESCELKQTGCTRKEISPEKEAFILKSERLVANFWLSENHSVRKFVEG